MHEGEFTPKDQLAVRLPSHQPSCWYAHGNICGGSSERWKAISL